MREVSEMIDAARDEHEISNGIAQKNAHNLTHKYLINLTGDWI
jgi:hypothetical protein